MRLDHLLRRAGRLHRDWPAIDQAGRSMTFGQLDALADGWTAGLARTGLRPGDRVAIASRNRVEYVAAYFALARLGAVAVPLNWRLGPAELAYILEDSGARAVVADADLAPAVDEHLIDLPALEHRLALDEPLPGWVPTDRFDQLSRVEEADDDPTAVVIQMYTSGTTGRPKGALLSHRNVLTLTTSWLLEMSLQPERDRFLQVTPLFHVGGVLMVVSAVARGATLVLLPEFDPEQSLEALAERGVTTALFVPTMLRMLLDSIGPHSSQFPDLRMIVYGASPISPPLLSSAMGAFGCDFLQGYGLTETAGVLTALRPSEHVVGGGEPWTSRLGSAGRALTCCEVAVVDEHDRLLPAGEPGELVARGDNVTRGYWKRPDATADALRGGWFHTGDVAWIDDDGFVTIVDRVSDMVVTGGENVYPREVEDVLEAHPAVSEAAVVGVPDQRWGEAVLALVVAKGGVTVDPGELVLHCRDRLAHFKSPTRVEVRDSLPRNAAGKLLKRELREPYWADRERRV